MNLRKICVRNFERKKNVKFSVTHTEGNSKSTLVAEFFPVVLIIKTDYGVVGMCATERGNSKIYGKLIKTAVYSDRNYKTSSAEKNEE